MKRFQEFIYESISYNISFVYNNEEKEFKSSTRKDLYTKLIDWLYEIDYNFKGNSLSDRLLKIDDVKKLIKSNKTYRIDHFHNIKNSDYYIIMNSGINQLVNNLTKMLKDMNITDIKFNNKDEKKEQGRTFIEAAQIVLKENGNKPMSSREIWDEIESKKLVNTRGTTPWATLNSSMIQLSSNTNIKSKRNKELFKITDTNPYRFILLYPDVEVQYVEEIDLEESDIVDFKNFRDIESDIPKVNPFNQAILILGESGAGKSYTIENILESSNHKYQFIIPTAATTGLLAQYSPSKSAYVPSRLGKMLIEASNNPSDLYTAVFDECHKSNVIEMINDELLQAISLKRNRYRFISLDDDTAEVFSGSNLKPTESGNIKIPDNFGFIFISSNPRVIGGNPDFFNRVDLIEVTEADRKINNIEELLSKKVEESSDKRELIDKLRSK